jgi:hypothetical protein
MKWLMRRRVVGTLSKAGEQETVEKFGREAVPFLREGFEDPRAEQALRRKAISGLAILADKSDAEAFGEFLRDREAEFRVVSENSNALCLNQLPALIC